MKLQRLLQIVYSEAALITPAAHASVRQLLEWRLGDGIDGRDPGVDMCGAEVEPAQMEVVDGVAVIPIGGVIGMNLSKFARAAGAVDVLDIEDEIEEAETNSDVVGTLFEIDSPGGMVMGTPDLADRVRQMRKPSAAFTRGQMASAAYWIGSAAGSIWMTQSAQVGSVGIYQPVFDESRAYEKAGVKVELIKAGKLKGIGYPGTSLSEEQKAHLQAQVIGIWQDFKASVRMRRPAVEDKWMEGQSVRAVDAVRAGLADGIVRDRAEVIRMLTGREA